MNHNLLIDIDGVICQYNFPELTKQYFGQAVPNKGIFAYSLEDSLGLPKSAVANMFALEVGSSPNLIPGAIQVLKHFIMRDYNILIYSHRLNWMTPSGLKDWLEEYGIPFSAVVGCEELPNYVLAQVDDSPQKLMDTAEQIQVRHSLLFDNPWNKKCLNITGRLERVKNWSEVRRIIDAR